MLNPDLISEIKKIKPFDELEREHFRNTLAWVSSDGEVYRTKAPDLPNKHLVCYFVVIDDTAQKLLLVDHKKAGLWLPSGGHVERGEHPKKTVERECMEELSIKAQFRFNYPVMITQTKINEPANYHTDVSLWYALRGDHRQKYNFAVEEFYSIRWFSFTDLPSKKDPHLQRFLRKYLRLQ